MNANLKTKNMAQLEEAVLDGIKKLIVRENLRTGHVDGPWKSFASRHQESQNRTMMHSFQLKELAR
eukprot:CAMPEP_0185591100 /NCGR_PEP_ID=MMETSP0434-20130131/63388_1 /TAXON_ID=626734 ORGANISM="Favella taraikaensis, Strain Fe Narragansett Bay" /NCGR_SAMPLE_ID=MMETSP0434 /ASSEMBLY_ACC=CAM_ASM_000379 /LENGTH=65 /DNA_ID=CAMNT_0028215859 /DNA_START=440 /DNA_END=634 /DNA_ORIENTATION=-